jgi:hypothetical protein
VPLVPLVLALAIDAWRRGGRVLPAAALTLGVVVVVVPSDLEAPALTGAPGLAFAAGLAEGLALTAVLLAALTLVALSPRLVALVASAALLLAANAAAWVDVNDAARHSRDVVGSEPGWVDALVRSGDATVLTPAPVDPGDRAALVFWNRSVADVVGVDPRTIDPATGFLPRISTPFAVSRGIEVAAPTLRSSENGALVRVGSRLRIAWTIDGIDPDGWSGRTVRYRRFGGGDTSATLALTVSRTNWGGPSKPAQVLVTASPLGGAPTAERRTTIDSRQQRIVEVPVPAPPFVVEISFDPTFSPADYGQGDTRQLGAQFEGVDYRR